MVYNQERLKSRAGYYGANHLFSGNKHFSQDYVTGALLGQTYQDYEQPTQTSQHFNFQSH